MENTNDDEILQSMSRIIQAQEERIKRIERRLFPEPAPERMIRDMQALWSFAAHNPVKFAFALVLLSIFVAVLYSS